MEDNEYQPVTSAFLPRGRYSGDAEPLTPPPVAAPDVGEAPVVSAAASSPAPPIATTGKQQAPMPARPEWSQYAPAEPHGLAKFGHMIASLNPQADRIVNEMPLERAERNYGAAAKDYDTEFEQGMKERGEQRAGETVTVTGPNGVISIPMKDYAKYLENTNTNATSLKKGEEANTSHEKIGAGKNETELTKERETNESHENVAQWANTSHEKIENKRAEVEAYKAKMTAGKVSPFVEREFGSLNDSYERLHTMQQNLEDGLKGDQQAMLSLLANHMGMTLGQIKGTRAGRQLIEEAQQSAPYLGRLEARFDDRGYLSGLVLTPEQMQSMVSLAQNKFAQDETRFQDIQNWEGARGGAPAPEHLGGPKSKFKEF